MKITRIKFAAVISIIAILTIAFIYGGDYAGKNPASIPELPVVSNESEASSTTSGIEQHLRINENQPILSKKTTDRNNSTRAEDTAPVEAPANVEQHPDRIDESVCTITVRCDTVLKNIDTLNANKLDIIPDDGIIMITSQVPFTIGESVFDVLKRSTKQNGKHLEFSGSSENGNAYIEGIGNLYEFDCGELSGWSYKVNGSFPSLGCSQYILASGDDVEWVYTCDLGRDIGEGDS